MSEPNHDRGEFVHPDTKEKMRHPSSIESAHHIGPDGQVVYSPAQKAARARLEAMEPVPMPDDEVPSYVTHDTAADAPAEEAPEPEPDPADASPLATEEVAVETLPPDPAPEP